MSVAKVALVFGGPSPEHEVSVVSARGVAAALRETALDWLPLAVTRESVWLDPVRSAKILKGDDLVVECGDSQSRIVFSPGQGASAICVADGERPLVPLDVGIVFPLMHGWGGEDGRIQGLLDWCGVRCVGSGLLGSAVGIDKVVARRLFQAEGLEVCPWLEFRAADTVNHHSAVERIVKTLSAPWFVKPACGGSSIGISKVETADGLADALRHAASFGEKIIVEQGIDAREIECAVLGNEQPRCADVVGEIHPAAVFYDYEAKYRSETSRLDIPAELPATVVSELRARAVRAYVALGLSGYARVDFLVQPEFDRLWLNEVNTLPGFTPISMFPKLWEASGLAYPALIEELVRLAS